MVEYFDNFHATHGLIIAELQPAYRAGESLGNLMVDEAWYHVAIA